MDVDFERTGILNPAVEPHRVQWLNEPHAEDGSSVFLDERAVRGQVHSPRTPPGGGGSGRVP